MPDYMVAWELNIKALTPLEAAKAAYQILLNHTGGAPTLIVTDDEGEQTLVNMQEELDKSYASIGVTSMKIEQITLTAKYRLEINRVGAFLFTYATATESDGHGGEHAVGKPEMVYVDLGGEQLWWKDEKGDDTGDFVEAIVDRLEKYTSDEIIVILDLIQDNLKKYINYEYPHGRMSNVIMKET